MRPARNTILYGDCVSLMRRLPNGSADSILIDPPYLVRYHGRQGRTVANDVNGDWLNPASTRFSLSEGRAAAAMSVMPDRAPGMRARLAVASDQKLPVEPERPQLRHRSRCFGLDRVRQEKPGNEISADGCAPPAHDRI